ncbi:MAG: hypothetical protein D6732_23985 [Methanobacteriota archaeon]|nr:MAG: hypothetical protein D6732_23985 [Euryarchaeota archaeon]
MSIPPNIITLLDTPGKGYTAHGNPPHYDLHEVDRITSKDPFLRKRLGGEKMDESNKVGHLEK